MSLESKVISAVCKNKDISTVFSSNVSELFVAHSDVWEGLVSYYHKFRAIPDVSVLEEKFRDFEPVEVKGETDYYVDQLKNEFLTNKIRDTLLDTSRKLDTDSAQRVLGSLQTELLGLTRYSTGIQDLNLTDIDLAAEHYDAVAHKSNEMGGSPGIRTGIKAIDASYVTGMAPGHLIVVIGWPGRMKQEDVDKIIPTPSGYRRFGDLSPGDYVFGIDGRPTRVSAIHPQTDRTAYRVGFSDGSSTIVGPEHLWSIHKGRRGQKRNKLHTMTTREILERGLYRNRKGHKEYSSILPLPEPVEYPEVDLPVDPYVMGVILGDGSYPLSSYNVVVSNNDEEIMDHISSRVDNPIVEYVPASCRRWSINGLHRTLRENGLCAVREDKTIPDQYMTAHRSARLDLLRGLMDSDGFSGTGKRSAEFSQKNRAMCEQVAELVRSLGGVAKVKTRKDGVSIVTLWTPDNPFLLSRKANAYTPRKPFKAFSSIERVEDREMMCITVEAEDSLYLTEHYTVTHNTWFTGLLAINAWKQGFKPMIVSLEMSPENMRDRLYTVMGEGFFRASELSRGQISTDDYRSWAKKSFENKDDFIIVAPDQMGEMTPNMVQAKIDQHKPDIVICDYHQLFMDNKRSDNMTQRAMNLSRELKLLAVANNIPVIDITAATMTDTSSQDDPPMLSQVAWSKAIEYDADMAVAVHKHLVDGDPNPSIVEIVSRKMRHGENFACFLKWDVDRGVVEEVYDSPGN
jgi:replicative DNA helicase